MVMYGSSRSAKEGLFDVVDLDPYGSAAGFLDAAVQMVTPPHTPVPFSPPLEDYYVPDVDSIIAAVKATL